MQSDGVIDPDRVCHGVVCSGHRREDRIEVELILQNAVDAFGDRVLIAVRRIRHAGNHVQAGQRGEVVMAAVLTAAIGVMHDPRARAERALRGVQGLQRGVMGEIATNVTADDVAGVQIGDQKQIGKRSTGEQASYLSVTNAGQFKPDHYRY